MLLQSVERDVQMLCFRNAGQLELQEELSRHSVLG